MWPNAAPEQESEAQKGQGLARDYPARNKGMPPLELEARSMSLRPGQVTGHDSLWALFSPSCLRFIEDLNTFEFIKVQGATVSQPMRVAEENWSMKEWKKTQGRTSRCLEWRGKGARAPAISQTRLKAVTHIERANTFPSGTNKSLRHHPQPCGDRPRSTVAWSLMCH